MSAACSIAKALHGRSVGGGSYLVRCPVPSHGNGHGDRNPSLMIRDGDKAGRVLVHCYARCDAADVLAELRRRGLLEHCGEDDTYSPATCTTPEPQHVPDPEAVAIWRAGAPVTDNHAAAKFLAARGLAGPIPPSLRAGSILHLGGIPLPALIAAVQAPERQVIAAQVTLIDPRGHRKAQVRLPRKTIGALGRGAIRLAAATDVLGLVEGTEKGLAAMQLFGVPCWSTLGAGRMHRVWIPASVRELYIFADNDDAGRAAAEGTASQHQHRRVIIRFPPDGFKDWDDVTAHQAKERETGMSGTNKNGADPNGRTTIIEPRFRLIPFDRLQPITKPAYLVKNIIPRAGIVVVWGPPKCGKSFWMTTTMLYVALGWEYRGHKVVQGAVVYCAFEGQEGYGQRAEAFRQHHLPEDADPVPFYLVAAQMNLVKDHAALIEAIKLQLGGTSPVAVVLDTLNRSLHGSESEDKDMAAYIQAATAVRETFNCAVVIIHHCGVSGDRPRGHTSLTGAADAQIAVKRDGAGYVIATVEWMKDGPEGTAIASKLEQVEVGIDDDGDRITSCVVLPVEDQDRPPDTAARRMTKSGSVFHDALVEALDTKGQTIRVRGDGPEVKAVNIEDVRPEFYARYITGETDPKKRSAAQRKAFRRAVVTSGHPTWTNCAVEWIWPTSGP